MLDHMIFSRLKWWNINDSDVTVKTSNKRWISLPDSGKITSMSAVVGNDGTYSQGAWFNGYGLASPLKFPCSVKIADPDNSEMGFFDGRPVGTYHVTESDGSTVNLLLFVDQLQNPVWGGKTLLKSLLYRASLLFRKQVVTC